MQEPCCTCLRPLENLAQHTHSAQTPLLKYPMPSYKQCLENSQIWEQINNKTKTQLIIQKNVYPAYLLAIPQTLNTIFYLPNNKLLTQKIIHFHMIGELIHILSLNSHIISELTYYQWTHSHTIKYYKRTRTYHQWIPTYYQWTLSHTISDLIHILSNTISELLHISSVNSSTYYSTASLSELTPTLNQLNYIT